MTAGMLAALNVDVARRSLTRCLKGRVLVALDTWQALMRLASRVIDTAATVLASRASRALLLGSIVGTLLSALV